MNNKDEILKPNTKKINEILKDYPLERVGFILEFVGAVVDRCHDNTIGDWDWCAISDDLGILPQVTQIIEAFEIPEDEFWATHGKGCK